MDEIIKSQSKTEKYFEEKCFITEIINSDKFNSFSISKAKVAPGITTELHSINKTTEVFYILEGKGEMEIEGKSKGIVEVGDAVYIASGKTQRIKNLLNSDLVFLCICSPRFIVSNYIKYN